MKITDSEPVAKVTLSGTIDENTSLDPILEIKTSAIEIECSKINRINSIGIEHWRAIFSEFRSYGRKLKFIQVSPVLVEVQNFISSFIEPSEEVSLCIPYDCLSCNSNTIKIMKTEEILSQLTNLGKAPCTKCGKESEMTEAPEEYFAFLIKGGRNLKKS